jgi:hypothetical protein
LTLNGAVQVPVALIVMNSFGGIDVDTQIVPEQATGAFSQIQAWAIEMAASFGDLSHEARAIDWADDVLLPPPMKYFAAAWTAARADSVELANDQPSMIPSASSANTGAIAANSVAEEPRLSDMSFMGSLSQVHDL